MTAVNSGPYVGGGGGREGEGSREIQRLLQRRSGWTQRDVSEKRILRAPVKTVEVNDAKGSNNKRLLLEEAR